MLIDRSTAVAFTGHRHYTGSADKSLQDVLISLYEAGHRVFVSGMAIGFDLYAAEKTLELRAQFPDVKLLCAVPFEGQESGFSIRDRARYASILAQADAVEMVCDGYKPYCYTMRNDFMIDQVSRVVAWYDGSKGGTRYTVQRAHRRGVAVINIYDDGQLKIPDL